MLDFLAAPTAEDVFKNLGETMDTPVNPNTILLLVAGGLGLILLLIIVQRRAERSGPVKSSRSGNVVRKVRSKNNPAKLIKELAREIDLKPAELKQLRLLAEQESLRNPLVLVLCPSVLTSAMKRRSSRNIKR